MQKSILLNFNIQQIPLNVSMVSLLILFGHFVAFDLSRSFALSICLFFSHLFFCCSVHSSTFCPLALSMLFYPWPQTLSKYICICNGPFKPVYANSNENFIMHAATRQMANRHMAIKSLQKTISSQQQKCAQKTSFSRYIQARSPFHSHFFHYSSFSSLVRIRILSKWFNFMVDFVCHASTSIFCLYL